jgi:repressor LexA
METLTEAQQELYDWLVGYIRQYQHSPSIRQMMKAMELKSPAPVQSRLEHLRNKGYIDWTEGRARTIRLIKADVPGVPIKGAIAAGGLVESFQDIEGVDHLDFSNLLLNPQFYALRVRGHSMIDALIDDGDVVIMQPSSDPKALKNGTIVAAHVNGQTTLKYFHRKGSKVTLQPGNPSPEYKPIEVSASQVDVQGILVGVWRSRL